MQKILIIDDETEVLNLLSEFLGSRGYETVTALDGEDALQKFDAERPDLVLCDIKMPKKDGFEFLKELRSLRKWVPVIIISALTEPANIMKGYELQADYYITKPINLPDTLKAVQMIGSLIPLRK